MSPPLHLESPLCLPKVSHQRTDGGGVGALGEAAVFEVLRPAWVAGVEHQEAGPVHEDGGVEPRSRGVVEEPVGLEGEGAGDGVVHGDA